MSKPIWLVREWIKKAQSAARRGLPTNAFARGVIVLVGGTAGAQLLVLLALPLVTRLYTPEDFGLLGVYASLLALLGVISSLRYEMAIPLPEEDIEAANVAALSIILVVISGLLAAVAVLVFGESIAGLLGVPQLAHFLWLLPLGILLSGAYNVFNLWAIRTKRFSAIAGTKVRQAITTVAIQLSAFNLGGIALLLAQVAGQSVGSTRLGRFALANSGFRQLSWRGIWTVAEKYRQFPVYSTPGVLFNTAGRHLPPILLAAFLGPASAGIYYLANRLIKAPITLITRSTAQVFLSFGVDAYHSGAIAKIFTATWNQSILMFTLPLAFVSLAAPLFLGIIFGVEWSESGVIVSILTPWILMMAIGHPVSSVPAILHRQDVSLYFEIFTFSLRIGGLLLGLFHGSLLAAVSLFSLGAVVGILSKLIWMASTCGAEVGVLLLFFSKELLIAVLVVGVGFGLAAAVPSGYVIGYLALFGLVAGWRGVTAFKRGVEYG